MRTYSLRFEAGLVAAALLLPAAAGAGSFRCQAKGGAAWREVQIRHLLIDTDAPPSRIPELVQKLELFHALELQAMVGEQVEIPGRLRVVAFANPADYRAVAPAPSVAGFASKSRFGEKFIALPVGGAAEPEVNVLAAHELAHHLSWYLFPRQPHWFSEGLAQFLDTAANLHEVEAPPTGTHIHRDAMIGGRVVGAPERRRIRFLALDGVVPAAELLTWSGVESESSPGRYHASSWLLYHYLWNQRAKELQKYQALLGETAEPEVAWRTAFPQYDPASPEALGRLDADLARYRDGGRYGAYAVEAKPDAEYSTAALGSADVHVLLADIRGTEAVTPEEKAAEHAEAEEAFAEDPNNPRALLAHLRSQGKPTAEAMRPVTAARPGDWRGWYLLGGLLEGPENAREKEAAYRKAVALNRDYADAQSALALLLAHSGRAREALPFANRAANLAPWAPSALDALSLVAAELGKCKEALILERRAIEASTKESRGRMEERLAEREHRCSAAAPATP